MGVELTGTHFTSSSAPVDEAAVPVMPWLDEQTAALVRATTAILAQRHPELRAVILYGSVARHEERPITDRHPSDVDLLLLVDLEPGQDYITYDRHIAIYESAGLADARYPYAPREVQLMLAWRDLVDWDETFVESVARDGILLFARGPLPAALAPVEERSRHARQAASS
jgi:predicted nucleotidyltransferase